MGIFNKTIVEVAGEFVDKVGSAFDKNFTTKEEKLQAKAEVLREGNDLVLKTMEMQKEVLLSEITGNWLQRSWRPVLMLCFGFIVIYAYFIQPAFLPNAVNIYAMLDPKFWNLLEIGMGGYVIGRSAEKIASSVGDAIKSKK